MHIGRVARRRLFSGGNSSVFECPATCYGVWPLVLPAALNFPRMDAWLEWVEKQPRPCCRLYKGVVVLLSVVALVIYYNNYYTRTKLEYNAIHPYTSWVPITLYIILRNMSAYSEHRGHSSASAAT